MITQLVELKDKTIVVINEDGNQMAATFEGYGHHSFAQALLKAIEIRCSECGELAGRHQEYFVKTGQDGGGSVDGYYQKCSKL